MSKRPSLSDGQNEVPEIDGADFPVQQIDLESVPTIPVRAVRSEDGATHYEFDGEAHFRAMKQVLRPAAEAPHPESFAVWFTKALDSIPADTTQRWILRYLRHPPRFQDLLVRFRSGGKLPRERAEHIARREIADHERDRELVLNVGRAVNRIQRLIEDAHAARSALDAVAEGMKGRKAEVGVAAANKTNAIYEEMNRTAPISDGPGAERARFERYVTAMNIAMQDKEARQAELDRESDMPAGLMPLLAAPAMTQVVDHVLALLQGLNDNQMIVELESMRSAYLLPPGDGEDRGRGEHRAKDLSMLVAYLLEDVAEPAYGEAELRRFLRSEQNETVTKTTIQRWRRERRRILSTIQEPKGT